MKALALIAGPCVPKRRAAATTTSSTSSTGAELQPRRGDQRAEREGAGRRRARRRRRSRPTRPTTTAPTPAPARRSCSKIDPGLSAGDLEVVSTDSSYTITSSRHPATRLDRRRAGRRDQRTCDPPGRVGLQRERRLGPERRTSEGLPAGCTSSPRPYDRLQRDLGCLRPPFERDYLRRDARADDSTIWSFPPARIADRDAFPPSGKDGLSRRVVLTRTEVECRTGPRPRGSDIDADRPRAGGDVRQTGRGRGQRPCSRLEMEICVPSFKPSRDGTRSLVAVSFHARRSEKPLEATRESSRANAGPRVLTRAVGCGDDGAPVVDRAVKTGQPRATRTRRRRRPKRDHRRVDGDARERLAPAPRQNREQSTDDCQSGLDACRQLRQYGASRTRDDVH